MDQVKFHSASEQQTRRLGLAIADCIMPGTFVALSGTLGAGKTRLVKSIAEGLGVNRDSVVSPTFALMQRYCGRLPLLHVDAYRIADEDEYLELGIEEYFGTETIIAMEWSEKFTELLPSPRLLVEIGVSDQGRDFHIRWEPDSNTVSNTLAAAMLKCIGKELGPECLVN